MNNNDNRKSERLWTHRLFNKRGASKALPQKKLYFARHYHADHRELGKIPFHALFTDNGNNLSDSDANKTDFQHVFEHVLSISDGKNEFVNPNKNFGSNSLIATEDSHCVNNLGGRYTILDCYNETLDTKTFRLDRHGSHAIGYLPGQYVTVSVGIEGQEFKRSYSLASTPTRPGNLEITVKRQPNMGVVSNWLNDNIKVGDTLDIKGPFGKFTCAKSTPSKILLLAAGSGIVPIMSMLRWLADTNAHTDVVLLLSFRTLYDIIYRDELNLIAARHNNIKLFISLTKEPLDYSQWQGLNGRVSEKMIADCIPDVSERAVYLCGPDPFMAESKQFLLKLGVSKEQLFCENFTVNSPQALDQANLQHSIIVRPLRNKTGNYRIQFAKSNKTITADGKLTLLELAEISGIMIGHECRAGNCGECMVKCLNGNIEMTEQAEIDENDRKKGWVYACCSYPVSNVVLEA